MRTNRIAALAAACMFAMPAFAQDARPAAPSAQPGAQPTQPGVAATQMPGGKVAVATSFPSKKLTGLNVQNPQGEKLGSIDDLVINIQDGKVQYIALSVGGVVGIGDKLFAVPFQELKFVHGRDEMHCVIDMSKEKLEKAPGFDKSNWPDFADPQWRSQVETYYRDNRGTTASRTTTTTNK